MDLYSPVFIIGMPRSGTTLLGLMLDTHSRIAIPNESHFIPKYYRKFKDFNFEGSENRKKIVTSILNEPYVKEWEERISSADIDLSKCIDLSNTINQVFFAYAQKFNKDIWADKTPSHINDIDILNALFPDSKFIHIVRDGRDVALSLEKQFWGPRDFMSCIKMWREKVTIAHKMLSMLPENRVIHLKFENLVEMPEVEIKKVTDFLGLNYETAMVTDYVNCASRKVGKRIHSIHKNLLKNPMLSQTYKWKKTLNRADQAIAYEYAHHLFEKYGYEAGYKKSILKFPRKVYFKTKEFIYWRILK